MRRELIALSPGMSGKQSGQPIGRKALAPAINVAVAAIELVAGMI